MTYGANGRVAKRSMSSRSSSGASTSTNDLKPSGGGPSFRLGLNRLTGNDRLPRVCPTRGRQPRHRIVRRRLALGRRLNGLRVLVAEEAALLVERAELAVGRQARGPRSPPHPPRAI